MKHTQQAAVPQQAFVPQQEGDRRPAEHPAERWSALVDEIAADARGRADSYPGQALVPEGGE